jgi:hypothetical protein
MRQRVNKQREHDERYTKESMTMRVDNGKGAVPNVLVQCRIRKRANRAKYCIELFRTKRCGKGSIPVLKPTMVLTVAILRLSRALIGTFDTQQSMLRNAKEYSLMLATPHCIRW